MYVRRMGTKKMLPRGKKSNFRRSNPPEQTGGGIKEYKGHRDSNQHATQGNKYLCETEPSDLNSGHVSAQTLLE